MLCRSKHGVLQLGLLEPLIVGTGCVEIVRGIRVVSSKVIPLIITLTLVVIIDSVAPRYKGLSVVRIVVTEDNANNGEE